MGLSVNEFTYAGVDEFDLNFALGYSSRTDIQCYKSDESGNNPVDIEFDWLSDSQVRVVNHSLSVGDKIFFTRTVSKVSLPVDLSRPSELTRENVTTAVQHSLYAMHELLDGRYGEVFNLSDTQFTAINTAVDQSLEQFVFKTSYTADIVMRADLTSDNINTYTSGNRSLTVSDTLAFVEVYPSVDIEVLVFNNDRVLFSCLVGTDGSTSFSSNSDTVQIEPGTLRTYVVGDNYVSGAEVVFVLPSLSDTVATFATDQSDYTLTYTTARDEQ